MVIKVEHRENLGPAMRALRPRQRRFVVALLHLGGIGARQNAEAAREAGYTGDRLTITRTAHRLAHDPMVLAAIEEEGRKRLHAGIITATSALVEIASDPLHKDRLKAAGMVLDRVGMHATTEHRVLTAHVGGGDKAMIGRIRDLAAQLGVDPVKLLGYDPSSAPAAHAEETVEAEYEEVEDWTAAP